MKIGICDDEVKIREMMADLVRQKYPAEEICLYGAGEDLLAEEILPDILFLDIRMPGRDGMETAKALKERNRRICIIFVTVLPDMVFDAFDVKAFHYLVKPFDEEKFNRVLSAAVDEYETCRKENGKSKDEINAKGNDKDYAGQNGGSILIKRGGISTKVWFRDIIYAEVFNRKVMLHTAEEEIEYYGRLTDLEKQAGKDFFRPHRAYLVNLHYITKYNANIIWLEKGQVILSKRKYSAFVKAYHDFCRREE